MTFGDGAPQRPSWVELSEQKFGQQSVGFDGGTLGQHDMSTPTITPETTDTQITETPTKKEKHPVVDAVIVTTLSVVTVVSMGLGIIWEREDNAKPATTTQAAAAPTTSGPLYEWEGGITLAERMAQQHAENERNERKRETVTRP